MSDIAKLDKSIKKFLYVEADQDVRDLVTMKFEADFGATVIEQHSEKDAINYLETYGGVDLVVIDDDAIAKTGSALYEFCKSSLPNVPFIVLSSSLKIDKRGMEKFEDDLHKLIIKPISENSFTHIIKKLLHIESDRSFSQEYVPVKIRNFIKFNSLPVDAYIRLSDVKFVKLINKDDMYSSEIIQKYLDKGINYLHVQDDDYPVMADAGIRNLLSLYAKELPSDTDTDLHLDVVEQLHQQIQHFGMTEEVVELTKKTIQSSVRLIKRHNSIASILNNMQKSGGYIYDHSLRVSYIAIAIAKQTEWNSDNTCFKLSLASMMHDMMLSDHELAKIESLSEAKSLNDEQIELIKKHPVDAAMLVRSKKNLPQDIDFIVLQHHERPDGKGFPAGLTRNRIAPFAALFILAHEFERLIGTYEGGYTIINRDKAFDRLRELEYHKGNFKKPFDGLEKAFSDKKILG